jgi:hypothetical protein
MTFVFDRNPGLAIYKHLDEHLLAAYLVYMCSLAPSDNVIVLVVFKYTCLYHYSATTTLQSLGIFPYCLPVISASMTRETGTKPAESSPVETTISSPRYPILSTGQIIAAVPVKKLSRMPVKGARIRYLHQKAQQACHFARQF